MTCIPPDLGAKKPTARHWLARLQLDLATKLGCTRLVGNHHFGPLRVQRPFYPEVDGTAHVYLLHPPGGLVLGDELQITAKLAPASRALITTPSAGKVYATAKAQEQQIQTVSMQVEEGACLEWLPQETIVFDGGNCQLHTRVDLAPGAQLLAWDIVTLGRPAASETFTSGRCEQKLELWQGGRLCFLERNRFDGGGPVLERPWGLAGCHTSGTLLATASLDRAEVDALLEDLQAHDLVHNWGLTQKENLFIARYRGHSAAACRAGFCTIWERVRPLMVQKSVVRPRIWNT